MYSTFKTKHSLYMVLEPCLGGELYSHMRNLHKLDEPSSMFYAACVVSALEHMHCRDIMYRDLKPENLVLSSNGYAKVVERGIGLDAAMLLGDARHSAMEISVLSAALMSFWSRRERSMILSLIRSGVCPATGWMERRWNEDCPALPWWSWS